MLLLNNRRLIIVLFLCNSPITKQEFFTVTFFKNFKMNVLGMLWNSIVGTVTPRCVQRTVGIVLTFPIGKQNASVVGEVALRGGYSQYKSKHFERSREPYSEGLNYVAVIVRTITYRNSAFACINTIIERVLFLFSEKRVVSREPPHKKIHH